MCAKRFAVVVGVSKYNDAQIGELRFTNNDAVRVAKTLVNNCQFDKERVFILADGVDASFLDTTCESPFRANIIQKVQHVVNSASDEDTILFYFAGHGAEVSQSPYLLSSDTRMDVLRNTGVRVEELNAILADSRSRCIIRIFDACRGAFGDSRDIGGRMTKGLSDALLASGKGWASFSSCSSGESAYEPDEFEHGVFSHFLCEGLEGKAANESGQVTFDRLVDYVKTLVGNWAERTSFRQTPHVLSDLSGIVVLGETEPKKGQVTHSPGNPFEIFRVAMDRHLAQAPSDVRNLVYTDPNDVEKITRDLDLVLRALLNDFSHPSMYFSLSERKPLDQFLGNAWGTLMADAQTQKVMKEFASQASAINIALNTKEVVIPNVEIKLAVVRFTFFYWVWFYMTCTGNMMNGFKPKPEVMKGFFTFKPKAVNSENMSNCVAEILKKCFVDIQEWSRQLTEYVDSRFEPLRNLGEIIE